MDADKIEEL